MNAHLVADRLLEASVGPSQAQLDAIMRIIEEVKDEAGHDVLRFEQMANERLTAEGYPIRFDHRDALLVQNRTPGRVGEDAVVLMPPFGGLSLEMLRTVLSHESVHVFQMDAAKRKGRAAEMFKSSHDRMMPGGKLNMSKYFTDKHEVMAHARTLIDRYRSQRMNKRRALQQLRTDPSAGFHHGEQRQRFLKNAYNYAQDLPESANDPDDIDPLDYALSTVDPLFQELSEMGFSYDAKDRMSIRLPCSRAIHVYAKNQWSPKYIAELWFVTAARQHKLVTVRRTKPKALLRIVTQWVTMHRAAGDQLESTDPDEFDPQKYLDTTKLHGIGRPTLDEFTRAYAACALQSSYDGSNPETGGDLMDRNYYIDNIEDGTLWQMVDDCKNFRDTYGDLLEQSGLSDEQAGYDLWLTANGHGTGFWDRDLGEVGDALTDAAHAVGETYLTVGDDGLIYA